MPKPKKKRLGRASTVAAIQNKVNAAMDKPVLRRGSDPYFIQVKIPTGSLALDRITGGGLTLGRHAEFYGDSQAGKSYNMLKTMALSQQRGGICALVDPEKVFDPKWFKHLGGLPDELLLMQPEKEWNAEDAVGIMMLLGDLMDEEQIEIVGVDSVASLVTQEEMAKDIRDGDDRVATQARMMSRALRRITTMNRKTLFIWTNQERTNIGFSSRFNPRTTPGGRALEFYATTRIEFRKTGAVKAKAKVAKDMKLADVEMKIGNWVQVRAEKEKSTRPFLQSAYIFDGRIGAIDIASEIIHLGLEDGLIERTGNYLTYEDIDGTVWKDHPKGFQTMVRDNLELQNELVEAIQDMTVQMSKVGEPDG